MFKTLNKNDILRGLESIFPKDIIKVDEPLKRYTYTETGGEADFIYPLPKMKKSKPS